MRVATLPERRSHDGIPAAVRAEAPASVCLVDVTALLRATELP